jgi:hypothetical protein
MNLRLPFLLIAITGVAFASDPESKPAPRPRLTDAVLQQGIVNMPARHLGISGAPSNSVPQDTAPYPVIGGGHGMVGRISGPSPMYRPFGLLGGGTFARFDGKFFSTEPMFQFDGPNGGWDLFKISWW